MRYNLGAPNQLREPCDLADLGSWYQRAIADESEAIRHVLQHVADHVDEFVKWAKRAILLWQDCDRVPREGRRQKYHKYPDLIRSLATEAKIPLDTRPNGPAITAYLLAGGQRPGRFGSSNAWSIHHLYSGKFPYPNRETTTHAVKEGDHFTQSAGLAAMHPITDALTDEFPSFAWLLRAHAFRRFGCDPDAVFSPAQDHFGFVEGRGYHIILPAA